MELLLSYLLLLASLCACPSWSVSSGSYVVTQSPDVSVTEGETVTISCCWTGEVERGRVAWLINQINRDAFLKNQSQGPPLDETLNCTNLTLIKITREDSGNYTCKVTVEIPSLAVSQGDGTVITVRARQDNTKDDTDYDTDDHTDAPIAGGFDSEDVLAFALRCLPILALVVSFLYLNKLASKNQQRSPAAPGNTPPSAQRIEEGQEEEERETEAE